MACCWLLGYYHCPVYPQKCHHLYILTRVIMEHCASYFILQWYCENQLNMETKQPNSWLIVVVRSQYHCRFAPRNATILHADSIYHGACPASIIRPASMAPASFRWWWVRNRDYWLQKTYVFCIIHRRYSADMFPLQYLLSDAKSLRNSSGNKRRNNCNGNIHTDFELILCVIIKKGEGLNQFQVLLRLKPVQVRWLWCKAV